MTNSDYMKSIFAKYIDDAEPIWSKYFEKKLEKFEPNSWETKSLIEYRRLGSGGKHVRACLVILGYELANKKICEKIMLASLSVECLHNAFLIHDDIVDKSDLRRNQKTIHKSYESVALATKLKKEEAKDFGVSVALNIGDLGQSIAQTILMESGFQSTQTLSGIKLFNDYLWQTVMGQMLDTDINPISSITENMVEEIHLKKTAYYSFVLPILLGFRLGDGDPQLENNLMDYSINIGKVYQMRDDVLGVFGDENKMGKSADSDILEGKKTLLIWKALQSSNQSDVKFLLNNYGNPNASEMIVKKIRKIIKNSEAEKYTYTKSLKIINEAKGNLTDLNFDIKFSKILNGLADYACLRER